jgi:hypothetical protein
MTAPEGWLLVVILANHDQNLVLGLFCAAYYKCLLLIMT